MLKTIIYKLLLMMVDNIFLKIIRDLVDAADIRNYKPIPATAESPEVSANEQRRLAVKKEVSEIKKEYGSAKKIGDTVLGMVIDAVVDKKRKEEQ